MEELLRGVGAVDHIGEELHLFRPQHGYDGLAGGEILIEPGRDHVVIGLAVPQQVQQNLGVGDVQVLGPASPGIAGEKLKGIRPQLQSLTAHGRKALGGGEMTADIAHDAYLPREIFCTEQMMAPSRMVRRPQVGRV